MKVKICLVGLLICLLGCKEEEMSLINMFFQGQGKITVGNLYHVIDGPTYDLDNSPVNNPIWRPNAWYHTDGCTYFVVPKQNSQPPGDPPNSEPVVGKYDPLIQSITLQEVGFWPGNTNYHNVPNIYVDSSGYIYIYVEKHAQTLYVFKSLNGGGDISTWETLFEFGLDVPGFAGISYPQIHHIGNAHYLVGRTFIDATNWPTRVSKSTDWENWDTAVEIATCTAEDQPTQTDIRNYNVFPLVNNVVNEWNYGGIDRRFTAAGPQCYRYKFLWKTKDFITYWNHQETFSKNVVLNGSLTDSELKTHFMYYDHGNYTEGIFAAVLLISEDGEPFMRFRMPDLTYRTYYWDSGWTYFETPDYAMNDIIYSDGISFGIHFDDNDKYNLYQSSDNGDAANIIVGGLAHNYPDPVQLINNEWVIPNNFWDIPNGKEFLFFMQSDRDAGGTENPENSDVVCASLIKSL